MGIELADPQKQIVAQRAGRFSHLRAGPTGRHSSMDMELQLVLLLLSLMLRIHQMVAADADHK
jgi:hypothetical protein